MILELLIQALLNSQNGKAITISMGGHMKACASCGQPQPHELLQIKKKKNSISIRNLDGYSQQYASQCEVCHLQTAHPNGIIPVHIERWTPHSDFHDYARRSGHPPIASHVSVKTPESIGSLLKSVSSTKDKNSAVTAKDYLLLVATFIVFVTIAVVVFGMRASKSFDGASDSDVYLLLGIPFVGFFLGVFLVHLNKKTRAKALQLEDFRDRLLRLGIQSDDILTQMPQSLLQNRRIYELIRPLMHGSH